MGNLPSRLADCVAASRQSTSPAASALLLASRFDTFGCVVFETLASGLPAVAYRTKGPKDIIEDGVCGYTVKDAPQMAEATARTLRDPALRARLSAKAIERASHYRADRKSPRISTATGFAPPLSG